VRWTPFGLAQGVRSPKHLMLDSDHCILCCACEDVCPWNCIYMMSPQIVEGAEDDAVGAEVAGASAAFVVDDNACTRCLALAGFVHVPYSPPLPLPLLGEMALAAFMLGVFGLMLASRIQQVESFQVVIQFFVLPMFFLWGGVPPR
jgi:ferredoxin